jgi:O-antigen biosynthesis protein
VNLRSSPKTVGYPKCKTDITKVVEAALKETMASDTDGKSLGAGEGIYYQYARPEVLQLVPLGARMILDIGCGAGFLGLSLKRRQTCIVTGLEIAPAAAAQAARVLDLVICGDAFLSIQGLPDHHFDAVIMADVLEHVADTDRMLQLVRSKMRKGGKLVLSIPNVRHWSVVKGLLEGQWEYESAGILDRMHLRFFTLSSIIRALAANGFKVEQSMATAFGVGASRGLVETLQHFGLNVENFEEDSNRYQYLFVCGMMYE